MSRKRILSLMLWIPAAALVVWLGLRGGGKEVDTPATRIATIHHWRLDHPNVFQGEPYLWLDSHEIFHFTGNAAHGYIPVSEDTAHAVTRPEMTLAAIQTGGIVSASPDGQWVFWVTPQCDYDVPVIAATRRSDGKTVRWRFLDLDQSTGFWLPDSHRWVGIANLPSGKTVRGHKSTERRLVICDVNQPGRKSFPIPGDTGDFRIMGVTADDKVILSEIFGDRGNPSLKGQPLLPLSEVTLTGSQPTARQILVPMPVTSPNCNSTFYLSPQGDRLLWTSLSFQGPSLLRQGINWASHSYHGEMDTEDIWVSHLNGTAPTHVGTWHSSDFGDIYWNPDGKHISLTMANGLYSIPVP